MSKSDPYRISLEFSTIFLILLVGKGRHLRIVFVTEQYIHIVSLMELQLSSNYDKTMLSVCRQVADIELTWRFSESKTGTQQLEPNKMSLIS